MLRLLILLALLFSAPAPQGEPARFGSDGEECCPGPPPICPPSCGSGQSTQIPQGG